MSFYGTVFYEFEQVFFKFKFKNNSTDNINIVPQDSVNGTIASERWDTFNLESGNRWIGMSSMNEAEGTKGVSIFHAAAGPEKHGIETLTIAPEGATAEKQLSFEQVIQVPIIKYDNAGHIVSEEKVNYLLPDTANVIETGMTDHFETDIDIKAISPTDTSSDVIVLTPGQIVATPKISVTPKGVIQQTDTIYYKLPESDAEKDYSELMTRMSAAEEAIVNNKNELDEKIVEGDAFVQDQVDTITETYATLEQTGTVDDLYNKVTSLGGDNGFSSLANAIGNLEASAVKIDKKFADQAISVADQISSVYDFGMQLAIAYNISNAATTKQIEELEKRIEALEAK